MRVDAALVFLYQPSAQVLDVWSTFPKAKHLHFPDTKVTLVIALGKGR